ncbi:MAG: permease [Bacteroidales bacterium]
MNYLEKFVSELIFILLEMAPYLMLGFFFAGVMHLLFPEKKVMKYLGGNDFRSIFNASLLGIPLPLCSCGVIPTGLSFYKHGASKSSTVSFLISTPQTGVDSIMVTWSLIDLPFAIIRPVVAFITGLFGGMLTKKINADEENVTKASKGNSSDIPAGLLPRLKELFRYPFVEFMQDISGWLVTGLLISALISVVVPDNFFADKLPGNFAGMFLMLVIAIPVYICATASVPVAAVLMLKGLSPGAALVLLMAGPATNAATITMIGKVMGKKTLAGYLLAITSGALIAGTIIDYLLPASWFTPSIHAGHMEHTHEILPAWLKILSTVILALLLVNALARRYFLHPSSVTSGNTAKEFSSDVTILTVKGMTCSHCNQNVEKITRSVNGVKEVNADFKTGIVEIKGDKYDILEIIKGIESIGYSVVKKD